MEGNYVYVNNQQEQIYLMNMFIVGHQMNYIMYLQIV